MIYTFDKKELKFNKVTWKLLVLTLVLIVTLSFVFSKNTIHEKIISEETKVIVLTEYNQFSEEKLDTYILELNLKFPSIIKAQAILETSNFKSEIFLTNHNLFGMKEASLRPTTAKGTNLNHAFYDNWKQSVVDYAFYQAAYLKDIKTEDEYFDYLKANYAEDTLYIIKLKQILNGNN